MKTTYNPAIHHRRSIRLKGYDYSQAGLYFITLCVQNREHLFGKIENGEMILNEYGTIAHYEWYNTIQIRPNIELGAFVVMPNHIHGIIAIRDECDSPVPHPPENRKGESHSPDNMVESHTSNEDVCDTNNKGECNSPRRLLSSSSEFRSPSNTVGAIIRGYKSAVTKQIRQSGFSGTIWQRNYYEHIIRNDAADERISQYIENNPKKWDEDRFCGNNG